MQKSEKERQPAKPKFKNNPSQPFSLLPVFLFLLLGLVPRKREITEKQTQCTQTHTGTQARTYAAGGSVRRSKLKRAKKLSELNEACNTKSGAQSSKLKTQRSKPEAGISGLKAEIRSRMFSFGAQNFEQGYSPKQRAENSHLKAGIQSSGLQPPQVKAPS